MLTEKNLGILAGTICGVLIGAVFIFVFLKMTKKDGTIKCKFDERQELIRGRGFKYGFFTLMIYDVLTAILADSLTQYADTTLLSLIGIFIAVLVYACYCIWNDGYFSLNENPKKVLIGFALLTLMNFLIGFIQFKHGGFWENGVLTYRCSNILCGIAFLLIFIVLFMKKIFLASDED